MKSNDDGGRGRDGPDGGVTPRYIRERNHLVTSAWCLRNQPDDISCFQRDRVFGPYEWIAHSPTVICRWRSLKGIKKSRHSRQRLPPATIHNCAAVGSIHSRSDPSSYLAPARAPTGAYLPAGLPSLLLLTPRAGRSNRLPYFPWPPTLRHGPGATSSFG